MRALPLLAILVAGAALARALPAPGDALAAVTIETVDGPARVLPGGARPLLIQYEDQDAREQNAIARAKLGRINSDPQNREHYEFIAIADVEKWAWWPARRYVLDDLRSTARRANTIIYADWKGALRKRWGLTRGKSAIVLVGSDGKVRFAGEGTLSAAQLDALVAQLKQLGVRVE